MNPEIPDSVKEMLEELLDGSLPEEERARLVGTLEAHPEWLEEVASQFAISGALAEWGRPDPGFASRTWAHVSKLSSEDDQAFVTRFRRRLQRRRIVRGFAAAAVLCLAVLPFVWNQAFLKPRVAMLSVADSKGGIVSTRQVRAGERLETESGLLRLAFRNGAVVAIEAPLDLTIVSGSEVSLNRGRLNAWCPASAHGFMVKTATAQATDLGTSFGVSVGDGGRSEFVVLDGLVEVRKGGEMVRLGEGAALTADHDEGLKSVEFDPAGFSKTWSLMQGILSTKGALVAAKPDTPERLARLENDQHVLVIPEKRDVVFDKPIRADVIRPGMLPGDIDGSPHVIPASPGKRLSAFQLRYNPVGTIPEEQFLRFEGEVTFDRPILAIQCQSEYLIGGEKMFALGHWEGELPGIERTQIHNPPDNVVLTPDRRTVKIVFYAGRYTDAVRVIVEDN